MIFICDLFYNYFLLKYLQRYILYVNVNSLVFIFELNWQEINVDLCNWLKFEGINLKLRK